MFKMWFIPIIFLIVLVYIIIYGAAVLGFTIDWAHGVVAALSVFFFFELVTLFHNDPNQQPRLAKGKNVLWAITITLCLLVVSNVVFSLDGKLVTWNSFLYMNAAMLLYIFLVFGIELLMQKTIEDT